MVSMSGPPIDRRSCIQILTKSCVFHKTGAVKYNLCLTMSLCMSYFIKHRWYVGKISAHDIDHVVSELSDVTDGMFLVRESITHPGCYCLYVW